MITELEPWSYQVRSGFNLRGWKTEFTGKPIIHFLHGNGFCGLTYLSMLQPLLNDFDLLITDMPGHGDSDTGGRFMGWNKCASLALEVLNHFTSLLPQAVPVYGVGHSWGGVLTALMMSKDKHCFDQSILMDPVIFPPGMLRVMATIDLFGMLQHTPLARQAKVRTESWPSKEAAFDYFYERGTFKGWKRECLQSYVDYALQDTADGVSLKCPPKREADIFGSYPKRLWPSLNRIKTPTEIWAAEKTFPFIARSIERLQNQRFFHSETVEGGHCFMQERPEEVAERLRKQLLG